MEAKTTTNLKAESLLPDRPSKIALVLFALSVLYFIWIWLIVRGEGLVFYWLRLPSDYLCWTWLVLWFGVLPIFSTIWFVRLKSGWSNKLSSILLLGASIFACLGSGIILLVGFPATVASTKLDNHIYHLARNTEENGTYTYYFYECDQFSFSCYGRLIYYAPSVYPERPERLVANTATHYAEFYLGSYLIYVFGTSVSCFDDYEPYLGFCAK